MVDILLWGTKPGISQCEGPPPKRSRWLAAVLHAGIAIAMRSISVQMTKMAFTMFQDTVPGPWQVPQAAEGAFLKCEEATHTY